jgi:hypothetical protein
MGKSLRWVKSPLRCSRADENIPVAIETLQMDHSLHAQP